MKLSTLLVPAFLLPAAAFAGDPIVPLLLEGDSVAGVGVVTRIDNLAVNDSGGWLVEADTDFSDTNQDQVLVENGALLLREDDPLTEPAGASIDSFDSINLNNAGDSGWNFFLDGTSGSGDDSGIYFNTELLIQESDVSTAPEFTPGTPYIGFFDAKIASNNSNQLMVIASVDDPAIASSVDRAIVIVNHDGVGNLVSESVLAKEEDVLAGQVEAVADFGTGPHQSAFNDAGSVLFFADLAGATATDGTIYLDGTLLAQEGIPSPVGGRNYEFLSSRSLDLSNSGAWVFKANLDGDTADDECIILNGSVIVREGDILPATGGFALTSTGTGSGPVQVDNAGNVLWFADWDDPDTDVDTGLFLNDQLLVQEGVSTVAGILIDTISSGQDAFVLSDNGFFVVFEATLDDGTNGAFLIDLSSPVSLELSQLAAEPLDRRVAVSWVTSAEVDHDGFHVYRSSTRDGEPVRLTDELFRGRSPYRFVDEAVEGNRTYFYRVGAVDRSGREAVYGPIRVETPNWSIQIAQLSFARPNPFVRTTSLNFTLPVEGPVRIDVHDVSGRHVRTLLDQRLPTGDHVATWDGRDDTGRPIPAGIYFSRLITVDRTDSRKIVYLGAR